METTYDIRIWKVERLRSGKHRVRWIAGGRKYGETFGTAALADSFRSQLRVAARNGVAFSVNGGLPVTMIRERNRVNWLDFACGYVDVMWKAAAPAHRKSIAEALTAITIALADSRLPQKYAANARVVLRRYAFNSKNRESLPDKAAETLELIRRSSGDVAEFLKPHLLRTVLEALARKRDGTPASPNYFNRRRSVLHHALKYAANELQIIERNPMDSVDETWSRMKKARVVVDRRSVVNPQQAARLLEAVEAVPGSGARLKAFFAVMYYAALRPEEAVCLTTPCLALPAEGWGELHLSSSAASAGGDWTDDGTVRQLSHLKHREVGDRRSVPCAPDLTAILRWHLAKFGSAKDGRLFRGVRNGRPIDSSTYERVWKRARLAALTPEQHSSPLAARPYDLRHAAVSTWLNAGVGPVQVAEWAGQSVKVLLEVYAKVIDGEEATARRKIQAALAPHSPHSSDAGR